MQPSLPGAGDSKKVLLGDGGWGLLQGFPIGESCGEHWGLRKADLVQGLPEDGAVSMHPGPSGPAILEMGAAQCPMSAMRLLEELFGCLGEDSGQLEDNNIGSCLTVAPKKC